MRCVATALLCAAAAFAQKAVTVDQLPAAVARFEGNETHAPLPCSIEPIKPSLNFGLRFQTGYVFRTALDPYRDGKHAWYIVFEVTPEGGGQPVYFLDSIDIPPVPASGLLADASGTFLLGEGHYGVKWSLLDDLGRVCQGKWTLDARLARTEKPLQVLMPPWTAGDFSWHPAVAAAPSAGARARHITVLINAALPVRRQTGRQTGGSSTASSAVSQWGTLVSILGSVLEHMPQVSVRLVVFNLDQQREIFRQENFTAAELSQVSHAADGIQQWKVDAHVLVNPAGGWNLLSDLVNKEIHSEVPPDTVVFLGLPNASREKMPPGMPERGAERAPGFLYLKYATAAPVVPQTEVSSGKPQSTWRATPRLLSLPGAASQPDQIEQSVRRLGGKTVVVSTPASLGKAIESIQH